MPKPQLFNFAPPVESIDALEGIVRHGTIVYERVGRDSKGQPRKWRVTSTLKRWKRDRNRMVLSLMHGLYDHFRCENLAEFNSYFATNYDDQV